MQGQVADAVFRVRILKISILIQMDESRCIMKMRRCDMSCFKDYRNRCMYTIWFGLGLSLATFCPSGLTLFIAGVILVAMGITLLRH